MEKRKRAEQRVFLSYDDKEMINSRNRYKCACCGKTLRVGKNFTVEHIIPLSQGGTNKPENLIGLCKKCNDEKADSIMPYHWYKYLSDDISQEVYNLIQEYLGCTRYVTENTFNGVDRVVCSIYKNVYTGDLSTIRQKGSVEIHCNFYKANYSDLDGIYNAYLKYNKKHKIDYYGDGIKRSLTEIFETGGIYVMKNTSNEIVGCFLVRFEDNGLYSFIHFRYPIILYNKPEYLAYLCSGIREILQGVHCGLKCVYIPLKITYVNTESIICYMPDCLSAEDYVSYSGDDAEIEYIDTISNPSGRKPAYSPKECEEKGIVSVRCSTQHNYDFDFESQEGKDTEEACDFFDKRLQEEGIVAHKLKVD